MKPSAASLPSGSEAASVASLREELSSLRDLLSGRDAQLGELLDQLRERDRQLSELVDQLAERDERLADLTGLIRDLRDEIRQLKGLPKRPDPKPGGGSGMDGPRRPPSGGGNRRKAGRGPRRRNPDLARREVTVTLDDVPEGAERKGFESHTVRDIVFHAEEVTYLREVWRFPDGSRHVAPLPAGVASGREQYGPGVKTFCILLYHQCQSTVDRIAGLLNDAGLDISRRQVVRFLNQATAGIVAEQQEVLRAGMAGAAWVNVDDTGARHRAASGYCTVIGNDLFTHFRTTGSKSRLNFLEHLCAGEATYTVNEAALEYMRQRQLSGRVIALLSAHRQRRFGDGDQWRAHLEALGIAAMKVAPNPARIASEGALWGAIAEGGRIAGTVVLSDDAGQFNVGDAHALCRVHAERLVRKIEGFNERQRSLVSAVRDDIWGYYQELAAYRQAPRSARAEALSERFDEIFSRRTGYATLDRLLARLAANKAELLRVLDHPETPLNTNLAENDIRAHVTRRKVSFGTRSDDGRAARDGCLGAMKTCAKLGVSFRDYLRNRLEVAGAPDVPRLADLVAQRASP